MNRDNNRAIKKMMATAAVLLASFAIIVLVMYGGMETSKASSIEKVYATYTNPLNNKTIKVSKKSAYGKATRSGNYQENIVIANNTFDTTLGDTLRLDKYKNVKITGNKFVAISSSYVMGQRIRAVACVNGSGVLLTNVKNSTLTKWASENYYLSSDGKYNLVSKNKNIANYKMMIK